MEHNTHQDVNKGGVETRTTFNGLRVSRAMPPLITFLVVLPIWEVGVRVFTVATSLLPPPSAIVATLVRNRGFLFEIGLYTFREAVSGFLIGCGLGVLAAILSVRWRWLAG